MNPNNKKVIKDLLVQVFAFTSRIYLFIYGSEG